MREMKDSGIEWIGKIPEDWKVGRVKDIFIRKNEKADEEDPIVLSLTRSGVKIRDISTGEGQLAESYKNYNPVEIDDFLLNPMDLYSGANCSISRVRGVISPAYINLRAKGDNNPAYYDYYFKTQYWGMVLFSFGKGVSYENRWTLGLDTALNYFIPIPPIPEQQKIAQFLDNRVATIDNIIDKIKETIEDYKKNKQSLITEVVTKGLDKNAEMKDSGVEWIGEIPEDWKVGRLKNVSNIYVGNSIKDSEKHNYEDSKDAIPYIATKEIDVNTSKVNYENGMYVKLEDKSFKRAKKDSILMCIEGGSAGRKIAFLKKEVAFVNKLCCFEAKDIYNKYLYYYLSSAAFRLSFEEHISGLIGGVSQEKLKSFFVCFPSNEEQQKIAQFLDNRVATIDNLILAKQSIIDELEQYKKSLIYEYVTGKKEVK